MLLIMVVVTVPVRPRRVDVATTGTPHPPPSRAATIAMAGDDTVR